MTKTKHIYLIIILAIGCIFSTVDLKSQQLPHFRNPYFNLYIQNPSTLVVSDIPDIMLDHRSQWIGFLGAPKVSTIAGKYLFRDDMGAGAYIMSDNYGLTQKLDFSLNYAYLLKTEQFYISFGLAWTLTQYKLKGTEISIYDSNDQVINQNMDDKTWKPDANAGIFVYNKQFYAGLSVLQLFKTKYTFFQSTNNIPGLIQDHRHFVLSGAYRFNHNNNIHDFSPFTNLYIAKSTPFKFDLGLNYSYNSAFLSSLFLSKSDALVFSAGYKYDKFYISYSFDFVLTQIRNVSSGAHEICIGVYLKPNETGSKDSSPMF
ncbi:MAG: PorP/SprF family type IX secretion system membrane protein [Bacteroidales bacterium]|nr:PorP/SprF family type IX secretion system membrane protein [Bacteroidales bacterium]